MENNFFMKKYNLKQMPKSGSGFTLSEVLITLGVIGVISTLTLPNLITNYEKQETASKLEKAYSTLQNAIQLSNSENPMNNWNWCISTVATTADCAAVENIISKLSVQESFPCFCWPFAGGNSNDCMRHKYPNYFYSTDYLHYTSQSYVVLLNDGTIMQFTGSLEPFWEMSIGIDINGLKQPNRIGRDIFSIRIIYDSSLKTYKLKPYFADTYCAKPTTLNDSWRNQASHGCFQKIIKDGWQIKDDYPWSDLGQFQ